jgi:CHAT domain-containing protein
MRSLGELYDSLIAPVEGLLDGASSMIIVPHGALTALPFSALRNRLNGKFLIEEYTVSSAPAVAGLSGLPERVSSRPISVFAPDVETLPASRDEARAISRASDRVKLYVGRSSTKSRVRQALARSDIVHVAAHGAHNSQNPLFSRVDVGGDLKAAVSDRTLAVHEILGMSTRAPLVFLSGCETGVSAVGEGVFAMPSDEGSLAQAFLFAGASNVIATLWPVSDKGAAALAADFYGALKRGALPSRALADAQRMSIKRRGSMAWAAFTVSSAGARQD